MRDDGKAFWVEILSRRDEVAARHKVHSSASRDGITVGRGYDNDIVLDDPHVAARHLRILRDEDGRLVAEDLGSTNGLFVGQDRRRVPSVLLAGGRAIRIGRTHLRVREADHAVAPERIFRPRARLWPLLLALACAVLGVELLSAWSRETDEPQLGDYLGKVMAVCGFVGVWAAAWSILSRVFSGWARFERHLLIAVSGFLTLSLVDALPSYAAFAFSRPEITAYRYIVMWLVGGSICYLHLRVMSSSREGGSSRLKLKAAVVATLTLVAIAMQTLSQWEESAGSDRQRFLSNLKPPALRLVAPQSEPAFFADVSHLKDSLDRARSEPAGRGGNYAGSDDDD